MKKGIENYILSMTSLKCREVLEDVLTLLDYVMYQKS
jgi:hypothetical protein